YLRPEHVDGVVLMSLHGDDPLPRQLAGAGTPTVLVGRPFGRTTVPYVDADNRGGARLAVEYLLSRGRKRVATIAGPSNMAPACDRLDAYRDGIGNRTAIVEEGDFGEDSGYVAMQRLLKRRSVPDAVF